MTWPGKEEEAVCISGVSKDATVERVIVNPDRTITVVVDDPGASGAEYPASAWRLERRTPEPFVPIKGPWVDFSGVSTEGAAWAEEG